MRLVHVFAYVVFGLVMPIFAATPADGINAVSSTFLLPDVTVVMDIQGAFAIDALHQMEQEASQIIGASGIRLEWRSLDSTPGVTFKDLVVITFSGNCSLDLPTHRYNGLGSYAFTHTANGAVQPFGQVDCDRIASSVKAAMLGRQHAHPDLMIGRALGRVVAHELFHMLTKSQEHGIEGVQKASLSGRELIGESLPLSPPDVDRLRQRFFTRGIDTPAVSETR